MARVTVRWRVVVRGRVQGVGFRAYCQRQARLHGAAGWVANRADGSVEAVFEGPPSAVAKVTEWCRRGPHGAVVTAVDVTSEPPVGEHGFRIA